MPLTNQLPSSDHQSMDREEDVASQNGVNGDIDAKQIAHLLEDLRDRANILLSELETFKEHLRSIRQEPSVETAHYHGTVKSELAMLERLCQQPLAQSSYHVAKSSNLPFLEAVWSSAKNSGRLVALKKRIYFTPPNEKQKQADDKPMNCRSGRRVHTANCVVDAIVDGGQSWIKISLVSNTRLLFDLAKQGWEAGDSDEEYSDYESGNSDDENILPVVKLAKDLSLASQSLKVRTKHPKVTLMLPRIIEGETKEIDRIIEECRSFNIDVICGSQTPAPALSSSVLESLAPNPFSSFSDIVNIDCTILLAIVSEFSHAKVNKEPWFHTALQRQVEIEDNENLLPALLYPAIGSHPMVCTKAAAKRMHEIVDSIGTPSEKARTAILMGTGEPRSQAELVQEMQQWSAYEVPADWQLPIKVVDQDDQDCLANLSRIALDLTEDMTAINKSIFRYGWSTGRTTITSNKVVVKQIESGFDKMDNINDDAWPKIWLCPTARSLVGKEKRNTKKAETSAMALPDPLRREHSRRNGLDVLSMEEGHEVEDLRPNGYDYTDVIAAKNAAQY